MSRHDALRRATILDHMSQVNRFLNAKQIKGQARRLMGPVLELTLADGADGDFNVRSEPRYENDIIRVLVKVTYCWFKVMSENHIRSHRNYFLTQHYRNSAGLRDKYSFLLLFQIHPNFSCLL